MPEGEAALHFICSQLGTILQNDTDANTIRSVVILPTTLPLVSHDRWRNPSCYWQWLSTLR